MERQPPGRPNLVLPREAGGRVLGERDIVGWVGVHEVVGLQLEPLEVARAKLPAPDRLAKRRLVKRLPDQSYGGGFQVQLTDGGLKLVDKVVAALAAGKAVALPLYDLPASERQAALRFTFKVISALEHARAMDGHKVKAARRGRTPRAAASSQR